MTGFEDKPFASFLEHCRLSKRLQDIVLYSVAMAVTDQSADNPERERVRPVDRRSWAVVLRFDRFQ